MATGGEEALERKDIIDETTVSAAAGAPPTSAETAGAATDTPAAALPAEATPVVTANEAVDPAAQAPAPAATVEPAAAPAKKGPKGKQDAKAVPVKGKAAAKPAVGKKGVVRRSVDAVVDKVTALKAKVAVKKSAAEAKKPAEKEKKPALEKKTATPKAADKLAAAKGKAAPAAKGKGVTGNLRVMSKGEKAPEKTAQASRAIPPTDVTNVEATAVVA